MSTLFEPYFQPALYRLVHPPVLSEVEVIRTKNPLACRGEAEGEDGRSSPAGS